MIRPAAALALVLVLAIPRAADGQAPAARATLHPVDEAARQPDFFTFRAALQVALAERDTAALLAVVDPGIKNSFGGDDGSLEFRRLWSPGDPASPLWATLAPVLALGGAFAGDDTFVAPYVFSQWPDSIDAFEHVAVVGQGVRVRAAPALDAAPVGRLDFAIVALATGEAAPDPAWTAIRLDGGGTGWVASRYVRSPIAHRAIFARRDGRWRLVTLVAGD